MENPLSELAAEIIRDYGEWIEEGIYELEAILLILLMKERKKNQEFEKWKH